MPRRRRTRTPLPLLMAELSLASWETIARRTALMSSGTCSPAEYRRMVAEKATAAAMTATKIVSTGGKASASALLAPWHSRATKNAKRLRRPKGKV